MKLMWAGRLIEWGAQLNKICILVENTKGINVLFRLDIGKPNGIIYAVWHSKEKECTR
ncbi:MAG TPA: hypothetical protein VK165_11910 [Azonexus sp.]|nr:hypothetical protein [Azonexus sp.]